jgi:hypothetical protein
MRFLFIRPLPSLTVNEERSTENCLLFEVKHTSRMEDEDEEDINETPTYASHAGRTKRRPLSG